MGEFSSGRNHSSSQTLTLQSSSSWLKPGILVIYWVCLKSHFTWGNSPSHFLHQLQPDSQQQGVCVGMHMCVCTQPHRHPPEQLFLGYLELHVNLLAMTSCVRQLLAFPLAAAWGERKGTVDFCTGDWKEDSRCFTQANCQHTAWLLVVSNFEEGGRFQVSLPCSITNFFICKERSL